MPETTIRLINWNTQADRKRVRQGKPAKIRERLARLEADIICLTEAHPDYVPQTLDANHLIQSQPATSKGWQAAKRKVIMWSRWGWLAVDKIGSADLPDGRYLHAVTTPPGHAPLHVVGVCVPYKSYSGHEYEMLKNWDGHQQYSAALKSALHPLRTRAIIAGDFNVRFHDNMTASNISARENLREALPAGARVITEGLREANARCDRKKRLPLIDHIVLTTDLTVQRIDIMPYVRLENNRCLSDHPLIVADICLPSD